MNYQAVVLLLLYMGVIIFLRYFRPGSPRRKNLIRKAIHLVTGIVLFFLTYQMPRQSLLFLIVAGTLFSFITYFIRRINYIHLTSPVSLGTLFYPVGILLSFLLLYDLPMHYFRVTLLFLAISDTIANLGGYLVRGNPRFRIFTEEKSLAGILGFALTAFLILILLLPRSSFASTPYLLVIVLAGIHFEIFSYRGSDNLTVPAGTALIFLTTHGRDLPDVWLLALVALLAPLVYLLFRYHILTRSGSILAYLLGLYFFGILGPAWGIPVIFFFLTSVGLTMVNSRIHQKSSRTGHRNVWQVTANISAGFLGSILYLISANELYMMLFIAGIAAVTADTWASETGPVFHKRCFSLATGSMAGSGVSGGISPAGSLGAFAGAFSVAMISWLLLMKEFDLNRIFLLTLSAFLASLVDSLLGAFLEPRMDKMRYFRSGAAREKISPNDVVNILASLSGLLIFLLARRIF